MGVNGIYGLSGSGIDIESMVKVGMMGKQKEYDKMAQKFTLNEWKKTALLDVNSQLTTFNMSKLSDYKMSSSMNAKTAESSDTSSVKVTANATAANMSHKVSVDSLSSNAYLISTAESIAVTDPSDSTKKSIKLSDVMFRTLSMDSDGHVTGTIKNSDSSSGEYASIAYEGSSETNFLGYALKDDAAISFDISDGKNSATISFTYDEILNGNKTLNDLASKINEQGLSIRASYDNVNDRFSLYNTEGGAENTIKITTGANTAEHDDGTKTRTYAGFAAQSFFNSLGLYQSKDGELVTPNGTKKYGETDASALKIGDGTINNSANASAEITGTDGEIKVDGVVYKTTNNKVTVGGITYNALNATTNNVTVTVSQDVDAIVDKVKSFVEDYNKILSSLYEKYDEKGDSGYKPLTQAQKEAMKDEQIEKWEEKAKKGLLYHDSTVGKIISEMREAISTAVEGVSGKYNSAYSIGISTTGIKGKLVLDETKLKKALAEDSDSVYNVFSKLSNVTDEKGNEDTKYNGIAQRLGDILTNANKTIKTRAGSSSDITEDSDLNNLLRELQTKMSNFKKLMKTFEDRLYKKYDAMETALAKLGTQLNFITGGQ
jgi:flagellar hook-associated protein 2